MQIAVLDKTGKDTGRKVTLPESIFGVEPNDHAIYLDVKHIQANKRQGTHKAKERAEIKGSTKKIKKQKGTGTARAGSLKSPVFVGGGRVFGPRPKDYSFKLNKKVKNVARRSALTYKAQENKISIIEDVVFDAPKTKEFVKVLDGIKVTDKSLFITGQKDKNFYLSSRNVENTKVIEPKMINTYDVLNAGTLVLTENSINSLEELLK